MKFKFRREDIATLLLVLLAFNCGLRLLKQSVFFDLKEMPISVVTFQENRLKGLIEVLPRQGVIGFAHDQTLEETERLQELFLTQYIFAPLIITEDKDEKQMIAYFKDDVQLNQWLKNKSFIILKDLKNGVALLQREK